MKICKNCRCEFKPKKDKQVFCCTECRLEYQRVEKDLVCEVCGLSYHVKPYLQDRRKHSVCSLKCKAVLFSEIYRGVENPNYKGRNYDEDGMRIYNQGCKNFNSFIKESKLHKAVCCEVFGISKIEGNGVLHVHHRDCDNQNNLQENLVLITNSDHKWLHKQFGNATLWAYMNGKVSLDDLISWSDDQERARKLLPLSILDQKAADFGAVIEGILYAKSEFSGDEE